MEGDLLDTCGTGGDRSGSINVSTISALVAAGAGGRVCKHGNRAASSQAGSADVLEALGVVIDLGPGGVRRCIEEVGMGFCFAPRFHPAMRHAIPVRRELGVPTVFNFLGPLANPARVRHQVVGVSDPDMAHKMLGVLIANGCKTAMVIHGSDGLDELSTAGPSKVHELLSDGTVVEGVIDSEQLGFARAGLQDIRGGDAATNAEAVRQVLSGAPRCLPGHLGAQLRSRARRRGACARYAGGRRARNCGHRRRARRERSRGACPSFTRRRTLLVQPGPGFRTTSPSACRQNESRSQSLSTP